MQTSSEKPINFEALEAIRALEDQGSPGILSKILGIYLRESRQLVETLETAVRGSDCHNIRQAAHRLKSTSASVGAAKLSALCLELEKMGRSGSAEGADAILAQLETEHEAVQAALQEQLEKTPG